MHSSWLTVSLLTTVAIVMVHAQQIKKDQKEEEHHHPNQLLALLSKSTETKSTESGYSTQPQLYTRTFLVGQDLSIELYQELCPHPHGKAVIHGLCALSGECGPANVTFRRRCDTESSRECKFVQPDCKRTLLSEDDEYEDMMIIRKLFHSNDPSQSAASRRRSGSHQPQTDSTNVLARHGVSTAKNHVASTQADTNYTTLNSSNGVTTTMTTGLSWKSSFSCANFSGNFSYSASCTQFVECVGKVPYVKMCPKGTKFHPTLLICDKEKTVLATTNCSSGGAKLLSNNYDSLKKSTSDKVETTRGGRVIKRETSSSREGREMSRRCSTGSTHDYYIQPHSQYCNKFEICSNGKIQEQTCGLGALFNPLSLVCDLPYNVDCESRRIDFSTYDCQPGDKYKTSHPDKCEQFIECDIKGTLHIKECPPSTAYDFEEEECVHIYKAKCKKPISLEHDSSSNVNYGHSHLRRHKRSTSSTSNRLNLACTFNYIAPHPEFCNKFVECEDGRIFIKDCGPGTAYNPRLGQCDWPHNVRQAIPQDCSRYRQCLGRQYVVKTCREDTIFDPEAGKCVIATGKYEYDADCRQQQFVTPLPS